MSQKIIDLVTAVVAPAIPDPYELVDIEYEKIGSDYILSVLIDKPGGITVEDTADLTELSALSWILFSLTLSRINTCWKCLALD